MRKDTDNLAKRVVEEPKRSIVPILAATFVAAIAVWTFQQQSIEDLVSSGTHFLETKGPGQGNAKGDLRTLFSADDYPADAQRNGEEGTVQAELAVDPRGRVSRCLIIRSSGHSSLDKATCNILERRARFRPARDRNGDAVGDRVITPPVVWRLEG